MSLFYLFLNPPFLSLPLSSHTSPLFVGGVFNVAAAVRLIQLANKTTLSPALVPLVTPLHPAAASATFVDFSASCMPRVAARIADGERSFVVLYCILL